MSLELLIGPLRLVCHWLPAMVSKYTCYTEVELMILLQDVTLSLRHDRDTSVDTCELAGWQTVD